MNLIPNRKSKYGKFDLVPEEGHELSCFIDFESKLIVVNETPIDLSEFSAPNGIISITPKIYIIEPTKQNILDRKEWKEFFNYEPIEEFSSDGKLKEIWIRKYDKERKTDFYEGYLVEIETDDKLINRAETIAFHDKKRSSLIERHYQLIEQRKTHLKSLEKGEYPNEIFQEYLDNLKDGETIFQYSKNNFIYQLKYKNKNFILYQGEIPLRNEDYKELDLDTKIENYNSIDNFWVIFVSHDNWFEEVKVSKINRVMEKFIITSHNQILEHGEISYKEHEKLHSLMNRCFNKRLERNVYWQFCSNCRKRVFYFSRYPKYACKNCVELIIDEFGNKIDYKNTHERFEKILQLKSNKQEVKIYIKNDEYWASGARFGGIVYQKKDKY